ncbi:MAG TPA: hypothetical protein DEG06_01775 [Lachnospiraceae bacterium]|jgi:hypothetical protein|nr:hypothetical protein [Lachnospiraceae bacterium]HBI72626.1 hypothetical protein [Lachnospiraceae bacterium]HBY70946.1 hypothetical protein [Lachnospiraceae bacterium]HCA69756.1 hypothetical protein [Lachnospiraceae bacterium]HCM12889.1 hypothetical protein [Lachnospiraceae bacterium]
MCEGEDYGSSCKIVEGRDKTTLNTVVLRETIYAAWKAPPFVVIWIPRVIEEVLGNTVKAYLVAVLLGVFKSCSIHR